MVITDRRVLFTGTRQTREWLFSKLVGVDYDTGGSWFALSVTGRQRTSGFGFPSEAADEVRLRLRIALADWQGTRDLLADEIAGPAS